MRVKPVTKDAYKLTHEGTLALACVEESGMRIDTKLMDSTIQEVAQNIKKLNTVLLNSEEWASWKKRFRDRASLGSRVQLGEVLLKDMGYSISGVTKTGKTQIDEDCLQKINSDFTRSYLELQKLEKLQSTYLKGIRREVQGEYLHPSFNLHLVVTYRSSSSNPNFQNIPIRNKMIGKMIRSCFIPRDDHVLVEIDYGALEFRIAACFWQDKAMVDYACDDNLDIHRDMAAECYCLETEQVTKQARFYAKNQFVFPTLYNSYYVNTSRNLWNAIDEGNLQTVDGVPLKTHLKKRGISKLGFEDHIKSVENNFNERFSTWSSRKEKWWKSYLNTGGFRMMTGFQINGVVSRNQLANIPIQGPAFHCLLWSLIQMVKWLKKNKMRTVIIGQIHDSIVADVHKDELDVYLRKAKQIMTRDVRKAWPWIITDLVIEAEKSSTNWYEKKEIQI